MNRLIAWESNVFDEIELVYEKAEQNENVVKLKLIEQLEEQALKEAKANVGMLITDSGKRLSPDEFDDLDEHDKQIVLKV